MIYNVLPISAVQPSDPILHTHTHTHTSFSHIILKWSCLNGDFVAVQNHFHCATDIPLLGYFQTEIYKAPNADTKLREGCWTKVNFFVLFCFLGLHLRHMEVSRLGVESELYLPV